MDTRLLYVIALIIATMSGMLYYFSGKSAHLKTTNQQNLSYTATKINVIRTSETGQLESKVAADHLQYWIEDKHSEMQSLNSLWYKQGQPFATFKADQAQGINDNEKVIMSGHIVGQKLPDAGQPLITFTTNTLTGYPKLHVVETDQSVVLQSAQGQMTSQGLKANLESGDFNLFRIRGQYMPAHGM